MNLVTQVGLRRNRCTDCREVAGDVGMNLASQVGLRLAEENDIGAGLERDPARMNLANQIGLRHFASATVS